MSEPLFHSRLADYLDSLVPPRDEVMQEMEAYAKEVGFPIIGAAAGYFNYLIARLMGATRVFELGSGYGYSTAWFARAVRENGGGVVHHVVWNEELSQKARGYLGRLGYGGIVQFHIGEAVETLRNTAGPFDLMFNDIDKQGYPASIPVIKEKLRPGGVLLIDNMLWHGAIFDEADQSPDTLGIHEVTRLLTQDPDFIASLVPIRDGVIMAYRAS
ncbi:MAG TPA: class I SAM-dependent methyltransferase [Chthonomonadaceae bacterium]|nr:class I SAM-dependent methyltransferase [Chthonomonadaceae bacterium]